MLFTSWPKLSLVDECTKPIRLGSKKSGTIEWEQKTNNRAWDEGANTVCVGSARAGSASLRLGHMCLAAGGRGRILGKAEWATTRLHGNHFALSWTHIWGALV
jgi:hypothetical protein